MRAHAYSKILSEVRLRQPEDGHYRPKHVVVHYVVIKYTSCDTVVFDYMPFSKFHAHNGDDTLPGLILFIPSIILKTYHVHQQTHSAGG